jgi:hypothetical protein
VTLGSAASAKLPITQQACSTGGNTFALTVVDAGQTGHTEQVLAALSASQMANIGATLTAQASAVLPGAQQQTSTGQWPDGRKLQHHALQFTHSHFAVRATVMGSAPETEVVDTFLGGARLTPR